MLAVAEVFIDTVLCCSMTGAVILLSKCELSAADGAAAAIAAFSASLGDIYGNLTAVFIAVFGLASVCGWFTFGCEAVKTLSANDRRIIQIYRCSYAAAAAVGAVISSQAVWLLSDALTGSMLLINILGMLLLTEDIKSILSTT